MIAPTITQLAGQWTTVDGQTVADKTCAQIEAAVKSLVEVAKSSDGWGTLYADPDDERLWELTFPQSGLHGGGPPTLSVISRAQAQTRYRYAV